MARTTHRTARIALRLTRGQTRRCFGLLASGGDVWAWVLDSNTQLRAWGLRPVVTYQGLCRELTGVRFGELDGTGARSVLKRYSVAWFEAAKRMGRGERAGFPRRKRRLMPLRYYNGTFGLEETRVRLPVARGCPPLSLRLSRPPPYPLEAIRSVTLLCDAGKLCLDVTAELPVTPATGDGEIAGVDLGIIHPYAVATKDRGLLVSGRALRAEERLHLEDTKRRAAKMGRKTPRRGQRGSRRYRKLRARQRRAEARHRRRIRQGHHEAAKQVVSWARAQGVSDLGRRRSQGHHRQAFRKAPQPSPSPVAKDPPCKDPQRQGRARGHRCHNG